MKQISGDNNKENKNNSSSDRSLNTYRLRRLFRKVERARLDNYNLEKSPKSLMGDSRLQGTRRNLFGSPDEADTNKFVSNEMTSLNREQTEKYQFDFIRGEPLKSDRVVWTKVAPQKRPLKQTTLPDFMKKKKTQQTFNKVVLPHSDPHPPVSHAN